MADCTIRLASPQTHSTDSFGLAAQIERVFTNIVAGSPGRAARPHQTLLSPARFTVLSIFSMAGPELDHRRRVADGCQNQPLP